MVCFGMVTTARSHRYTLPALASFLRHTPLAPDDQLLVIDNDGGFELPPDLARAELIRHPQPRSFAANVNFVMRRAGERKADMVFLNNDMIFTENWLAPLSAGGNAILLPMCNQHMVYERDGLTLRSRMDWEDYAGHERALDDIAWLHRTDPRFRGQVWRPPRISFYCFRLPRLVQETVGPFDEEFGLGGGEDVDYRLRALNAGLDVAIAMDSYVLHFMGKSTWDSGETEQDTKARDARYVAHFAAKWGEDLARLFLFAEDARDHAARLGVEQMMLDGNYRGVIARCRARRAP